MKFSFVTVSALLLADTTMGFVAPVSQFAKTQQSGSTLKMALDMPPPESSTQIVKQQDLPVIQQNPMGQPSDVRYSDFLKLVNADKIEKVTFSSDGSQLLGVDVDGTRLKIESLPNDPDLLSQLTQHKVCGLRHVQHFLTVP